MSGTSTLSPAERAQLGTVHLRRNGTPSAHPFPDASTWERLRVFLLERSACSNPQLDRALTAYTPGETVALLDAPAVAAWHARAGRQLPERYRTIVLVPCAKTKPWTGPGVNRSKLYSALAVLRAERPDIAFVTVSEPLGIVTMKDWADFPQYDCPGLFHDDAQRSGMTAAQWAASPFAHPYSLPFDQQAYEDCILRLGGVVADFLAAHADRRVIACLDGPASTHAAMLDAALRQVPVPVERHPKRDTARVSPLAYLRSLLP